MWTPSAGQGRFWLGTVMPVAGLCPACWRGQWPLALMDCPLPEAPIWISRLMRICVDALRGSRAFLAWDCHVGCRFVSGLLARPMAAGLDGLSASRGSHLNFALDAHSLTAGLPR